MNDDHAKLLMIAYNDPETYVAQVTYLSGDGSVSERAVSPIAYLTGGCVRVYCLGRESIRTFRLARILRVRLRLTADVLCPEAIQALVTHTKRLRPDKSTDTTADGQVTANDSHQHA